MANRMKSNSDAAKVANAQAASAPIQPPAHVRLRARDKPFWNSIVSARASYAWIDADLEIAGNLARCKSDIERISKELEREGDIRINANGSASVNPKHSLLETLSRRAVALSRMLHIHAEATEGNSQKQPKAAKAAKAAKESMARVPDSSLIPRLAVVK